LKEISSHYETKESLPDALIENILKAKHVCVGLSKLNQIFFARFDMEVHGLVPLSAPQDLLALWKELKKKIALIDASPDCILNPNPNPNP
jgi:oligopeptidase A